MTDDLTCHELLSTDDHAPSLLSFVALDVEKVDLAEAIVRRVQTEAATLDRRNPRYVEQVQHHGMTVKWRARMCRWMFATGEAFKLALDTVGAAVHFMDLYLSQHSVDHVVIQLVAMLSLCVASKMHEHRPMSMLEMDLLCEHKFSHAQIIAMEAQLLEELNWALNPVVSFTFARDLLLLAEFETDERLEIEEQVNDLLQHASIDYNSLGYKSSVVGCAALYMVAQTLVPHGASKVLEVMPMLDCDDDEFDTCVGFVEYVHDAARGEARQLASPTSVDSAEVVVVKAKTETQPKTMKKRSTSTREDNKPTQVSRKRSRDAETAETATPKRRRLAMD